MLNIVDTYNILESEEVTFDTVFCLHYGNDVQLLPLNELLTHLSTFENLCEWNLDESEIRIYSSDFNSTYVMSTTFVDTTRVH